MTLPSSPYPTFDTRQVGDSGKRHVLPAEWVAWGKTANPPAPVDMAAADIAAIPDVAAIASPAKLTGTITGTFS